MIQQPLKQVGTVTFATCMALLLCSQAALAQVPPPPPSPPPPGFSYCASEGAFCSFTGTHSLWVTWCSPTSCMSVSSGSGTNGILCSPASLNMAPPPGYSNFICYASSSEIGPATLSLSAAASTQSGIGRAARFAIDGDLTTRWEASNSSPGSWLQVNGPLISISNIEIREYGNRIRGFRLEYKSLLGGQWTRIAEGAFVGNLVIDTRNMPLMQTSSVRLITTERANGQPSISEFIVTGTRVPAP
jgi:hypothetical protein